MHLGGGETLPLGAAGLLGDAQHERDARPVDVGVHEADVRPELRQGQGEIGCDRRLADAALAAGDRDHARDAGDRLRSARALCRRLLAPDLDAGDARHRADRGADRFDDLPDDLLVRRARRELHGDALGGDLDVLHHPEGDDVAREARVAHLLQALEDLLGGGHRLAIPTASGTRKWARARVP